MKRILGLAMALFFASAITGCAKPKYNYTALETSSSQPPNGSANTSYVGDVMLSQGKYKEHDSIYVTKKIDVIWAYSLTAKRMAHLSSAEYFLPPSIPYLSSSINLAVYNDAFMSYLTFKDIPRSEQ